MAFDVIPAIDVSGGKVVRLTRGERRQKTVYADDPAPVAKGWEEEGARRLHVVDLDAAFEGEARNREAIEGILRAVGIPVQVGGGIRTLDAVRGWIDAGADRVLLGTAALTDEAFLREAVAVGAERIVVALDVREGEVRIAGWTRGSGESAASAARRLASSGVPRVLVTDIAVDGTMGGPNLGLFRDVAQGSGLPVIASGGVAGLDDIRAVASLGGVEAVVVGKALYEGTIHLRDALEAAA